MRITGGTLKGRTIHCPPGIIRPSMDRMRESLFSILAPLEGLSFLDLFTGSGIITLEAASRGADPVRAVEMDRGKKSMLEANLLIADPPPKLSLMPAERFVMAWKEAFDIIFLDPPFPYKHKQDLLLRVGKSKIVHPGTKILIHYPAEDPMPEHLPANQLAQRIAEHKARFLITDKRSFGRSQVAIYTLD
jgi:16S rRNA (guanine966-N2)-methyltransferase